MSDQPPYLVMGEILRPHGLKGEVRVRVLTGYPERFGELKAVYLGTSPQTPEATRYEIESFRMNQEYALLKFVGIDDRSNAEPLRALYVMVTLEDAVPLDEGEVYLYQLIGMTVQTRDGEILGSLRELMETGANDVFIVDSPTYGEILIPDTDETDADIDADTRTITLNIIDGLLPNRP